MPVIQDFYRVLASLDREAEIARSNAGVACRGQGCCGCCYQMIAVQSFEALGLGLAALQRPDWTEHAQLLAHASRPFLRFGMTYQDYFRAQTLCCYGREGPCEIYPARPVMCRFYYVVGHDPRPCWPPGGSNIQAVDMRSIVVKARAWAKAGALSLGVPDFLGPLAPMVLWAMELLADPADPEQRQYLDGLVQNRPDVFEWSQRAVARIPR